MEYVGGILNGSVSSDFRDRGGGGGGGGAAHQQQNALGNIGVVEEFGSLEGSINAHAVEVFNSDLFCWLVEGLLILVNEILQKTHEFFYVSQQIHNIKISEWAILCFVYNPFFKHFFIMILHHRSSGSLGSSATASPC